MFTLVMVYQKFYVIKAGAFSADSKLFVAVVDKGGPIGAVWNLEQKPDEGTSDILAFAYLSSNRADVEKEEGTPMLTVCFSSPNDPANPNILCPLTNRRIGGHFSPPPRVPTCHHEDDSSR